MIYTKYPLFIKRHTKEIFFTVEKIVDKYITQYQEHSIIDRIFSRIKEMVIKGKCIRGNLFCFGLEMFGGLVDNRAYTISAGLEILQTSLLIHDDIIDLDSQRRGDLSYYTQFAKDISTRFNSSAHHYGVSIGITAGDIGFFLAVDAITNSEYDVDYILKVISYLSKEVITVGVGQSLDIFLPYAISIKEQDVLMTYIYKTGRYTVLMPLCIAALICEFKEGISLLEKWAEKVGIVYQLRDDYINLFGNVVLSGKSIGSDIIKRKKTWWFIKLLQKLEQDDRKQIHKIHIKDQLSKEDIDLIYSLIKKYQIKEEIENCIKKYKEQAELLLRKLPINKKYLKYLKEFTQFVGERTS